MHAVLPAPSCWKPLRLLHGRGASMREISMAATRQSLLNAVHGSPPRGLQILQEMSNAGHLHVRPMVDHGPSEAGVCEGGGGNRLSQAKSINNSRGTLARCIVRSCLHVENPQDQADSGPPPHFRPTNRLWSWSRSLGRRRRCRKSFGVGDGWMDRRGIAPAPPCACTRVEPTILQACSTNLIASLTSTPP